MTGDDGTERGLGGLMMPAIVYRLPHRRGSPVEDSILGRSFMRHAHVAQDFGVRHAKSGT